MGAKNGKSAAVADNPSPKTNMTEGWGIDSPDGKITLRKFEMEPLGPKDVEVEITHCGLCHSDVCMHKNLWGMTGYPLIAGHEAIGRVKFVGPQVTCVEVGQRVGVGWIKRICGECRMCKLGKDNLCQNKEDLIAGNAVPNKCGGFAKRIRLGQENAIPIPKKMPSAEAAPLLCAGITVFAPLDRYTDANPRTIGVIGLGGLGSLAIKFASKMHDGKHTVVGISRNSKKKELAMSSGAADYLPMDDPDKVKEYAEKFDLVLNCVPVPCDFQSHLNLIGPAGTYCVLGGITKSFEVAPFWLLGGERQVVGSCVGSVETIKKMLNFCVKHGVYTDVYKKEIATINETVEEMEKTHPFGRYVFIHDAGKAEEKNMTLKVAKSDTIE